MTRKKAREDSNGLMDVSTTATGRMANSMEKESILTRKAQSARESGKMDNVSNGLRNDQILSFLNFLNSYSTLFSLFRGL